MELLVSPTERGQVIAAVKAALAAGDTLITSSQPERMGVDFAWFVEGGRGRDGEDVGGWFGVQRKTHKDFLASLDDGRLTREVAQMRLAIEHPTLVLEGEARWLLTDVMTVGRRTVTRAAWVGAQLTIERERGVKVMHTADADETGRMIAVLMGWSAKAKHGAAVSRPKAIGEWGKASSAEWACHLLQGFEGIGPDTARAIIEHFGRVPLSWDVSERELREVRGVGKSRAAGLMNALTRKVSAA